MKKWGKFNKIQEVTDTTIIFAMDKKLGKRGIEFIEKKMYDIYLQSAIEATLNKPYEILFCVEGEELPSKEESNNSIDGHIKLSLNWISSINSTSRLRYLALNSSFLLLRIASITSLVKVSLDTYKTFKSGLWVMI